LPGLGFGLPLVFSGFCGGKLFFVSNDLLLFPNQKTPIGQLAK